MRFLEKKTLFLRKFFGGELRFHEIYFISKGFFVQFSIRVRTGGGGNEEDGGGGGGGVETLKCNSPCNVSTLFGVLENVGSRSVENIPDQRTQPIRIVN